MLSEESILASEDVKALRSVTSQSATISSKPYTDADVCSAMRYHWKLTLTQ